MLPVSPRRRRRLAWSALVGLGLAAAVASAVLLPDGREPEAAVPATAAPARDAAAPAPAPAAPERTVELTRATRSEINATLARFIAAGVRRDDPALAWELAGPKLRTGWTRRDWLEERIPVAPFPAKTSGFEGWRKIYAHERRVGLDLILHPTTPRIGALGVGVEMVRSRGRWLVDEWIPVAAFTPVGERQWVTGIADFQAGGWTDKGYEAPRPLQARLGSEWLLAPLALLAAVVVVPIGLALRLARRNRRARLDYASSAHDARVTWRGA